MKKERTIFSRRLKRKQVRRFERKKHAVIAKFALKGSNKELLIIEGANHTDLYYKTDVIPFAQIAAFYQKYL